MKRAVFIILFSLTTLLAWSQEKAVGDKLDEEGTRIELPGAIMLQVSIDERKLVGYFIDEDGLVIESPAESIVFEVDQPGHRMDEWRTVIKPVDGIKLTSPRSMAGPYQFRARLIIRFTDGSTETVPNAFVELDKKPE